MLDISLTLGAVFIGVIIGFILGKNKLTKPVVVPAVDVALTPVIDPHLEPIVNAMIEVVKEKKPDDVLFIMGNKPFKAKDVKKHLEKKDKFAEVLVKYSLKSAGWEFQVPREAVEKAVKMFEMDREERKN